MMKASHKNSEAGNAFLYVLIGVVLFAALMFTFTRSTRQGGENISSRKADLAAVELIDYGQRMSQALSRVMQKGCSESQLDFGNDTFLLVNGTSTQATGHNAGATAQCNVFAAGSGVAPQIIGAEALTIDTGAWNTGWQRAGHGGIYESIITGVGTGAADLILHIPGLKRDVCLKVNDKMGVTNPTSEPPVDDNASIALYDGTINATGAIGDNAAQLAGKRTFCYQSTTTPAYYAFVTVIMER